MLKNFYDISKMQCELNTIIGRNTISDKNKSNWLVDYTIDLLGESWELFECINFKHWTKEGKKDQYNKIIDLKNAKIEAIDCLHFLVSIIQILNLHENLNLDTKNQENLANKDLINNGKSLGSYTLSLIQSCIKILSLIQSPNSFKFINLNDILEKQNIIINCKDESKENIIIIDNIKTEVLQCLLFLCSIFEILEMSDDEIYEIYKMKHEKNILRQKNGYSVLNKTEADNNEIKEKI